MIKAKHNKAARMLFNVYISKLLKKNFSQFRMINEFPEISSDKGLIITPNHISWWDGFFIDAVTRKYLPERKIYLLMLEEELKKYWFFRYLGAYSINQKNRVSISKTVRYSKSLLKNNSNFMVLYPQGEIEPFDKRPPKLEQGIRLFGGPNDLVLPAAFKIEYASEKQPSVLFRAGKLLPFSSVVENFEEYKYEFERNMDNLNKASFEGSSGVNILNDLV